MSSVERSQSSQNDNAAREIERAREPKRDAPREEPKAELVDRFRTLMQSRADGKEAPIEQRLQGRETAEFAQVDAHAERGDVQTATDQAIHRKGGDEHEHGQQQSGGEALQPAELAALMQAQVIAREAPAVLPAATPQGHANPQALADMLERHVRQLAISHDGARAESGQVLLRLNDATLPGTDLLLSRTETGWLLRADVRSRGSFDAIREAAPKLAERFAARDLGELTVDPHFHG
jgi:hypothetical protein